MALLFVFLVAAFLIISALTMRPSLLGELMTPASMIFAIVAFGLSLFMLPRGAERGLALRNLLIKVKRGNQTINRAVTILALEQLPVRVLLYAQCFEVLQEVQA